MKTIFVPPLNTTPVEGTIAVSVSTYKKPEALKGNLQSILDSIGPGVLAVNISDDNDGECEEIAKEFSPKFEEAGITLTYSTGENKGVAANKNRGIKFFLEDPVAQKCNYLILSDDDIKFTKARWGEEFFTTQLLKATVECKMHHITGYLGHYKDPLTGNGFFKQFPPIMEDEYMLYCGGSQGILLFFTREAVLQAGYFDIFPTRYGYEHALYSNRINRIYGFEPRMYPILKNCHRYFGCQNIANNYEVIVDEVKKNSAFYLKRLGQVIDGVGLTVTNSGV